MNRKEDQGREWKRERDDKGSGGKNKENESS